MFGLIFFAGIGFMFGALALLAQATYMASRAVRVAQLPAVCLSVAAVFAVVYAINAKEIRATRTFNKLCNATSGRHIEKVVKDVEGIRVSGNLAAAQVRFLDDKYQYSESSAPRFKRRHNRGSSDICGKGRTCDVENFSARYELNVRSEKVAEMVSIFEQRVIDSNNGTVLGTERTYSLETPSNSNAAALFLFAWRLPVGLWVTANERCTRVGEGNFVNQVLLPVMSTSNAPQ